MRRPRFKAPAFLAVAYYHCVHAKLQYGFPFQTLKSGDGYTLLLEYT